MSWRDMPSGAQKGPQCPGCNLAAPATIRYRRYRDPALGEREEEVLECLNCGQFYVRGEFTACADSAGLRNKRRLS